jgi:hypothetical protein
MFFKKNRNTIQNPAFECLILGWIYIQPCNPKSKTMSENFQETKRIFTGPAMIAKGLVARLSELGIQPIERNDNDSSIQAGFAIGVPGQLMVFIRKDQLPLAEATITEYLKEIEQ